MTRPFDTTPEAHAAQVAVWRGMSPAARAAEAVALSVAVRDLARAGIRARHPEYRAAQVERALLRLLYPGLAERALGPGLESP